MLQNGNIEHIKYTCVAGSGAVIKLATPEVWLILEGACTHVTGTDLEFIIYKGNPNSAHICSHKPCLAADGNDEYPFYNTNARIGTAVKYIIVPAGGSVEVWGDTGAYGHLQVLKWYP